MTQFSNTTIQGCYRFQLNPRFEDERGLFSKPLHLDFLKKNGINFECRESFVSFSKPNVLRGLHYQLPPYQHDKVVSCLEGEVFDVVLDLRRSSKTFKTAISFRLRGGTNESLFIPAGCAHGFQTVSESGAWVAYYTSKEYHGESDTGVLWNSIPVVWPGSHPIISKRDQLFPKLGECETFE